MKCLKMKTAIFFTTFFCVEKQNFSVFLTHLRCEVRDVSLNPRDVCLVRRHLVKEQLEADVEGGLAVVGRGEAAEAGQEDGAHAERPQRLPAVHAVA